MKKIKNNDHRLSCRISHFSNYYQPSKLLVGGSNPPGRATRKARRSHVRMWPSFSFSSSAHPVDRRKHLFLCPAFESAPYLPQLEMIHTYGKSRIGCHIFPCHGTSICHIAISAMNTQL